MDVRLCDITQSYGRKRVLNSLTLNLRPGVTALLGPNGAGKSTLMRTLVTDLPPRSGQVIIGSEPIKSRRSVKKARECIGYLPQNFGFDSRFTVYEHVEYLAWLRSVSARKRRSAVESALEFVSLMEQRNVKMGALSGGSRQRAGIAGAMVGSPDLLVLDEPTVGLDPGQRATFRRLVAEIPASYVLLSTHLTDDVEAIGEHLVLLFDGQIVHAGSVQDFLSRFGTVEKGYLAAIEEPALLKEADAE
jgi:ABC-2 type transport system ATP-binding protein